MAKNSCLKSEGIIGFGKKVIHVSDRNPSLPYKLCKVKAPYISTVSQVLWDWAVAGLLPGHDFAQTIKVIVLMGLLRILR